MLMTLRRDGTFGICPGGVHGRDLTSDFAIVPAHLDAHYCRRPPRRKPELPRRPPVERRPPDHEIRERPRHLVTDGEYYLGTNRRYAFSQWIIQPRPLIGDSSDKLSARAIAI